MELFREEGQHPTSAVTFERWFQNAKLPTNMVLREEVTTDEVGRWTWTKVFVQVRQRTGPLIEAVVYEITGNNVLVHSSQWLSWINRFIRQFERDTKTTVSIELVNE